MPAGAAIGDHALGVGLRTGRMSTTTPVKATVWLPNLAVGKPATQKSLGWGGAPSRAGQADRPTAVKLPDGTRGRYVRVQLASPSNPLSLAEVQVRGSAD